MGTSSTKTILVNMRGELLAAVRQEYPMYRPHPGWAENDPDDWVKAVEDSVKQAVEQAAVEPSRVKGLCIVAQRDPIVLLDADDRVLAPSISWTDRRDLHGVEQVYEDFGHQRLIETTGLIPVPGLTLPNIYWIRRHRSEAWQQTRRILATKDYVLYRLTGQIATDTSTPSRQMLYDLRKEAWSEWICQKAEIDVDLLPPIKYRPWEVWGELSPQAAERLGLEPGTVLAAGGGDDPSAAVGAGAIDVGDVVVGTGTAACFRVVTDRPTPDSSGQADLSPHLVPERYVYELVVTGTGTSLRWFNDTFGALGDEQRNPYERLLEEAGEVPAGADGLLFYPYLEGARAPHFNEDATGVFFGILTSHTRAHCVRAIVEAVAFQYPPLLEMLESYGGAAPDEIILVDDEARSELWNQIKADVVGLPVRTPQVLYGAALGAAILAALAAGLFPDAAAAAEAMIIPGERYRPDPQKHAVYQKVRERYDRVYEFVDDAYRAARQAAYLS